MSTRGYIAIKDGNKYKYIFNHDDSCIDYLGIILFKYYKDKEKIETLINLGNVMSVGSTIENKASCYKEYLSLENFETRGTVAFFREGRIWKDYEYYKKDRQWEDCKPIETEDVNQLFSKEFIEWVYIFDTEKNKWYMAYKEEGYELKELEEMLHIEENVIKYADAIGIYPWYRKEFIERCMNA